MGDDEALCVLRLKPKSMRSFSVPSGFVVENSAATFARMAAFTAAAA